MLAVVPSKPPSPDDSPNPASSTSATATAATSTESVPESADLELELRGAEARAILVELCREDINTFAEYVLRDEESGERIQQLDFHVQIQHALDRHKRIVVMAHPESGKTNQLAVARVLWELGRNPNLRVMIVGNTQEGAKKSLQSIKKYIEKSEELHLVFPELQRGDLWQDVALTVQRPAYSRDPSVQAVGYGSNNVLGSRVDLMIFDDLLNMEVTSTEAQRRKVSRWVRTTALSRCTREARVAFLTNAWHPRDLSQELVKERGWHLIKRPIRVPANDNGQRLVSVWPERWPEQRIKEREKEFGSLEFQRIFMCEPRDEGDLIFKPEFFVSCKVRGRGVMPVYELESIPPGCVVVSGVDIGGRRVAGALTVISTLFFHPNGTRQPLWCESGRWGATEMINRIVDTGRRYKGVIAVENNGVQQHLVDLAIENDKDVVSIYPYYTGAQKADPRFGVASMASELEGARWIWPTMFPDIRSMNVGREFEELEIDMLDYTPEQHTGDRLMATWIAREVGRRYHALMSTGAGTRVAVQTIG